MKKQFISFMAGAITTVALATIALPIVAQSEYVQNNINITVNKQKVAKTGESFTLDNGQKVPYSINYNGTTYLPMRKLCDLLGQPVTWDNDTRTAIVGEVEKTDAPQEGSIITPSYSDWTAEEVKAYQEFKSMWKVDRTKDYFGNQNNDHTLYMDCGTENKAKLYDFCSAMDEESMRKISMRASRDFLMMEGYGNLSYQDDPYVIYRCNQKRLWKDTILLKYRDEYKEFPSEYTNYGVSILEKLK